MGVRVTHKCHDCKEVFRTSEMINYTSLGSKTSYWYCQKCYKEKIAREEFSQKICYIFGIKAPGPKIWTERKRIKDMYGYTDDTIVDCLDYVYNIEKTQKKSPTLFFVNPTTIEKMKQYQRKEKTKNMNLAQAMQQETHEYLVPIKENNTSQKKIYDPDEWLGD